MQDGQIREEERDRKTKGQRVWNKNKENDREQNNSKQRTVHRSIYARRWQQRAGSLNITNRRKDTDTFVHVTKGLLDEVVERMRVIL